MIIELSQLVERRPSKAVSEARHDIPYAGQQVGAPKAITAMAHKLARILWHLIKYREAYDRKVWAAAEEKLKSKRLQRLEQSAAPHGFKLDSLATSLRVCFSRGGIIW